MTRAALLLCAVLALQACAGNRPVAPYAVPSGTRTANVDLRVKQGPMQVFNVGHVQVTAHEPASCEAARFGLDLATLQDPGEDRVSEPVPVALATEPVVLTFVHFGRRGASCPFSVRFVPDPAYQYEATYAHDQTVCRAHVNRRAGANESWKADPTLRQPDLTCLDAATKKNLADVNAEVAR